MALPSYDKEGQVEANAASDKYADNDEEVNGDCVMEGKFKFSMGTPNKCALPENADTAREHSTGQSREEERKTARLKQLEPQHRCQHQRGVHLGLRLACAPSRCLNAAMHTSKRCQAFRR